MIKVAALTGGIACGKSLLEHYLQELGCQVLDADVIVRLLQEPGGDVYRALVDTFGDDILDANGRLDRGRLGELVFSDIEKRTALEELVHPMVRRVFTNWLEDARDNVIYIGSIPLLYECGWDGDWPYVICIGASPEVQIDRMVKYRGMSEKDAQMRLAAQLPVLDKMNRSDYVVWNNSDDPVVIRSEAEILAHHLRTHSLPL